MNPRRVLCILPTWVGDAVLVTPAIRALRRRFPDAELWLFGRGNLFPLLDGGGLFDGAVATAKGPGRVRANVAAIRAIGADLAVIFPHSFRTAWEVFRAGIRHRLGYRREGRGVLLTQSLSPHRSRGRIVPVPMVYQYLELVSVLGAEGDGQGPELPVPEAVSEQATRHLSELGLEDGERLLALNPGAAFGPSKIWPLDYLARVADHFREDGARVLILCGPGEEALARELAAKMERDVWTTADHVLPLDVTKGVLQRADLLITTDAGPRHIARAVGTPALVLMGPTDPRYTDSHLGATIVLRRDVPCGPCHLKVCPLDHRCLRSILPPEVITAAEHLLVEA